eukprot:TRINITY_DN86339_c0_g1_i1.p1 TRINITY_DN86339_c0_g1~~TRINITY_DN86339_c0_g1_i1.p1  ORF type:complete len:333 (-),score=62.03 TRINITY_DN86339_c0_g1_i1:115-981(-)
MAAHAQAQLEETEEWKLEQDAIAEAKKPVKRGWRNMQVAPPMYELEDQAEKERQALERAPSIHSSDASSYSDMSHGSPGDKEETILAINPPIDEDEEYRGSDSYDDLAVARMASHSTATFSQLGLAGALSVETDEDDSKHLQLALPAKPCGQEHEAPSAATETCLRRFFSSPEGQVYGMRHVQPQPQAQPHVQASSSSSTGEWLARTSRTTGRIYYVNSITNEAKWTPPHSAREAWTASHMPQEGTETPKLAAPGETIVLPPPARPDNWKRKRLKNGVVVSVRVQDKW